MSTNLTKNHYIIHHLNPFFLLFLFLFVILFFLLHFLILFCCLLRLYNCALCCIWVVILSLGLQICILLFFAYEALMCVSIYHYFKVFVWYFVYVVFVPMCEVYLFPFISFIMWSWNLNSDIISSTSASQFPFITVSFSFIEFSICATFIGLYS